MDRGALARRIDAVCRLSGEFTLRSGQTASTYFDKYRFEADPELLGAVAAHAAQLVPADTEVLAGLELGGVPVVTALALTMGLPVAFVRKERKPYGTRRLAEGAQVADRRVLVVEDVIATGGQVLASTRALRAEGAHVDTVLCVIDRNDGEHRELTAAGLVVRALFTARELAAAGRGEQRVPLPPDEAT